MADARTLVDILLRRADRQPHHPTYLLLGNGESEQARLCLGDVAEKARAIAALLQQNSLGGERVLLLYPPGLDFISAFLGCLLSGAVAVPSYPPRLTRGLRRLEAIVGDAQPRAALMPTALCQRRSLLVRRSPLLSAFEWLSDEAAKPGLAGDWKAPDLKGGELAFLQYTSGSTASPKGVMVSHANLLDNLEQIRRAFRQDEDSVVVGWLPLYHDMGLVGNVLQPLYSGGRCILMPPAAFLQKPLRWLQAISHYQACTSGGPDFAFDLCRRRISVEERQGLDLSCWQVAFCGAEPVRAATLEGFAQAFAPCGFDRRAFVPCYGLAEATLLVSGACRSEEPRSVSLLAPELERHRVVDASEPATPGDGASARRIVSCGPPANGLEVLIADPQSGRPSAPHRVGEVWVAGSSRALGYWGRPQESRQTFCNRLPDEPQRGPYLRSGDLGFLREGHLYITGRIKDLLIIRGRNHYPQDIERTAEGSHPAVQPGGGAAFAVEDQGQQKLVLAQEVRRRPGLDLVAVAEAVRRAVAEEHQVTIHEVVLLRAGTVPKTSSGKIQRHACRQKYLEGKLRVVAASSAPQAESSLEESGIPLNRELLLGMPAQEQEAVLRRTLRQEAARALRLAPDRLDAAKPLTAQGLDSLSAAELAHSLREGLELETGFSSLLEGVSVESLANWVRRRLEKPGQDLQLRSPGSDAALINAAQRALWFLHGWNPQATAYHVTAAARVRPALEGPSLQRAVQRLVDRHPALRTTFEAPQGEPRAIIHPEPCFDFEVEDARGWEAARLQRRVQDFAYAPFDLHKGPLLRFALFHRSGAESLLALSLHHIVCDFWSLGIITRELAALYAEETGGPPALLPRLSFQVSDHADWQRRLVESEAAKRLESFWLDHLKGAALELAMQADRPRPPVQTFRGAALNFRCSSALSELVEDFAHSKGATLFSVLLAALQALLARMTGQDGFLIGSPAAGRRQGEFRGVVGCLINTLALRADLSGDPSFEELTQRSLRTALQALAHQDYPFPLLVERLQPQRDPARSPLFQAMLSLQQASRPEEQGLAAFALNQSGAPIEMDRLSFEPFPLRDPAAPFDLMLSMAQLEGCLSGSLHYSSDLFDASTMRRLAGHFQSLLQAAVQEPQQRVSRLPLMSRGQLAQLVEWNALHLPTLRETTLDRLAEAQSRRTPHATAVQRGSQHLSFAALENLSSRLAGCLQKRAIGPEKPVGVHLDRSVELVWAILGILKAGAPYLPMDPAFPQARIELMLQDSRARLVLTRPEKPAAGQGAGAASVPALSLLQAWAEMGSQAAKPPLRCAQPGNLAYVMYTSGSTGRPKGVAVEHRSAVALMGWGRRYFSPGEIRGMLASTSICFDLSVFELFLPLSWGGTIILAVNALELPRLAAAPWVTLVNTVPSAISGLLDWGGLPKAAGTVNLAGEALKGALARRVCQLPGVRRVCNLYGPSEDTTYSTAAHVECGLAADPDIGRPLQGSAVFLEGRHQSLAPMGAAGELCLAGAGLARGYLGRPAMTAERFVPDPWSGRPGRRLYRTGDLAHWLADGRLQFLGRSDHQVKIRGFRIELAEVERVLESHPEVRQAVVTAQGEDLAERRLLGHWVRFEAVEERDRQPAATPDRLRHFLEERLPHYMVPDTLIELHSIPLTPNGKVDRSRLPQPQPTQASVPTKQQPSTPVEGLLAGIWSELLRMSAGRIGVEDDFFALGGHSLLAARMTARVRDGLGVELPVVSVFESPTLKRLARRVEAARRSDRPPLVAAERSGPLPLSFAQQRLWLLDRLTPAGAAYNMSALLDLKGELDFTALQAALAEIVLRHESLRTSFAMQDEQPCQSIAPPLPDWRLPLAGLRALPGPEALGEARRLAHRLARLPFDLSQGPLLRLVLVRLRDDRHQLIFCTHHAIADGWSVEVFFKELAELYGSLRRRRPTRLEPLAVQYSDYALWQRRWLKGDALEAHATYWRRQLAEPPSAPPLLANRPRPAVQSLQGDHLMAHLPEELCASLQELASGLGATLFMCLAAAFQALLYRCSGQRDILMGTPSANREEREVEGLIGCFVNMLVLRGRPTGGISFRRWVAQVRQTCLQAYAHQQMPFEKLVEELGAGRDRSHTPLFQVAFALQESPLKISLAGLEAHFQELPTGASRFDLSLWLQRGERGLQGRFEYSRSLFDRSAVLRMAGHFVRLLQGATLDPDRPLGMLPLMGPAERMQLLQEWSGSQEVGQQFSPVQARVLRWAERTPDQVALEQGEEFCSYAALVERASRLAYKLSRLGAGPETVTALLAPRSIQAVAGNLAVLLAGGAYLPLDPVHPGPRLAAMLSDSGALAALCSSALRGRLPETGLRCLFLEREVAQGDANPSAGEPRLASLSCATLAYLIYTSGSTGRPKGVGVPHSGLANLVRWHQEAYQVSPSDRAGWVASPAFDASVWEIWPYLTAGARLAVPGPDDRDDPARLATWMVRRALNLAFLPTPMAEEVLRQEWPPGSSLRALLTGGDRLHRHDTAKLPCPLYNHYGPTESSVVTSWALVEPGRPGQPPIGRPIRGLRALLLDRRLQPVPMGVPGELAVGGAGLARGYLGRPALTADRFVPDPVGPLAGERLYRSGDLCRWLEDGQIDFLGRLDDQVQVRGSRVELGEIESLLATHPAVRKAALALRNGTLVAYVVAKGENGTPPQDDSSLEPVQLRRFLEALLPAYMLPSAFVALESLPVTPSGKVDRQRLPEPQPDSYSRTRYVAPSTPLERRLVRIWSEFLDGGQIGIEDNFFERGGYSLLATRVTARLRKRLEIDLPANALFESPTIAALARRIEEARQGSARKRPPIVPISRERRNLAAPQRPESPAASSKEQEHG